MDSTTLYKNQAQPWDKLRHRKGTSNGCSTVLGNRMSSTTVWDFDRMTGKVDEHLLPNIIVDNPAVNSTLPGGKFVTFEIRIKSENRAYRLKLSSTRRRYSEFVWLRARLQQHSPRSEIPELPPRTVFRCFDEVFLEDRRRGLEEFLNNAQHEPLCLSDTTFHLFAQTDLTCEQIAMLLTGKLSQKDVEPLWKSERDHSNVFRDRIEPLLVPDRAKSRIRTLLSWMQ